MASISTQELIAIFVKAYNDEWGYIFGAAGKEWTEKLQKQLIAKMVSKYGSNWKTNSEAKDDDYYMSACYGDRWIGHTVADCSGLFVFAFNAFGIRISHSSHYQYTDYCVEKGVLNKGKRSDGKELKPGTAVFIYKAEKNRYTHVGLYIGNGEVVEAASTQKGVIKSKVTDSKWNRWGELKYVDYKTENLGFPETPGWRATIRRGDKGDDVTELQVMLWRLGYDLGPCGVDGDFGRATQAAVKEFQKTHGLTVDGVCGPLTWDALEKASVAPPDMYTVTIYHVNSATKDSLLKEYPNSQAVKE